MANTANPARNILWHSRWILVTHPSLGEVVIFADDINSPIGVLDMDDESDFREAVAQHLGMNESGLEITEKSGWCVRRKVPLDRLASPGRHFGNLPRWSRVVDTREEAEALPVP